MSAYGHLHARVRTRDATVTFRFADRGAATLAVMALGGAVTLAQTAPSIAPLRTAPIEKFTVNPGFRDWAPTVLAGTTLIGGNSSNRGGLFAVDTVAGKLKWSFRPTGTASGNPFVATAPAVSGGIAIAPMGNTLVAVTIATGREAWRGPATAQSAAVAADGGLAFVLGEDANFHALDAATGREKWAVPFPSRGSCNSVPVARGGSVFVSRNVVVRAGDANRAAEYYRHLVALDASTGEERWRYPASPAGTVGMCVDQAIVTGDTYFAVSGQTLYAINLTPGRDLWPPVEVRAPIDGRERAVGLAGLVDAGAVLVGVTPVSLMAFDKATGRRAWEVPGQYRLNSPSTAVAGGVLYVQGHPGAQPAPEVQGRIVYQGGKPVEQTPVLPGGHLNAIDLATRTVLWSFSRPTAEVNWPFGYVIPVDGGLWVDSYQALVKLQ
jgi:outer membrane protein assembly factor BamB